MPDHAPTNEEWIAWKEHPVTRWFNAALLNASDAQKAEWDRVAWAGGTAHQGALTELRTRADTLRGLNEITYERVCELNGDSPTE